jgi:excisionase family DNA binding protein
MPVQPPDRPHPHPEAPEQFVSAEVAAEFLSVTRRFLLDEARAGRLPAHPLGRRSRKQWRFRLSELARAVEKSEN